MNKNIKSILSIFERNGWLNYEKALTRDEKLCTMSVVGKVRDWYKDEEGHFCSKEDAVDPKGDGDGGKEEGDPKKPDVNRTVKGVGINAGVEIRPEGKNEFKGFSPIHLREHHDKHAIKRNEPPFNAMTPEEYNRFAVDFLSQECGGDIDGFAKIVKDENGNEVGTEVIRFNRKTGVFARGFPGKSVGTCYNAEYCDRNGNMKKYHILKANTYYHQQKIDAEKDGSII